MDLLPLLLRKNDDGEPVLCAPKLGEFSHAPRGRILLEPGASAGVLRVLQRRYQLVVPAGVLGLSDRELPSGRVTLQYGQELVGVSALEGEATAAQQGSAATAASGSLEIKAPIDGIFYRRPSPDAPSFVQVGDEVSEGQTLGLIEVMKTFNPVQWGGPTLPARARVTAIEADDQQEVASGQVLLRFEDL